MDQRSERVMVFAQDRHHIFRLGRLSKRGEAAHVAEQYDDFASVAHKAGITTGRDDRLGDLRWEETLEPADPLDFADLRRNLFSKGLVPCGELGRLLLEPL